MNKETQLKKLERKAYLSYHKDGLIDIIIGLSILGFGVFMFADNVALSVLGWIAIFLYLPLKKFITLPRLGYVRFKDQRTVTYRYLILIFVGVVAFLFFLGMFVITVNDQMSPEIRAWLKDYHMLVFASMGALIFVGAAAFMGIRRFYAYAAISILIVSAGIALGLNPHVYVAALGIVILAIGLLFLVRFLKKYPQAENDVFETS